MTDDLTALRALAEAGKALDPCPIGFGTIEAYRAMHNVLSFDAVLALLDRLERAEAAIERAKAEAEKVNREQLVMSPEALILADAVIAALDTGKETEE